MLTSKFRSCTCRKRKGGFAMRTTPVRRRNTTSVRKKPHGSRRNINESTSTNTGELKMMEVASPSGSRRNEKKSSTNVRPPTTPCNQMLRVLLHLCKQSNVGKTKIKSGHSLIQLQLQSVAYE